MTSRYCARGCGRWATAPDGGCADVLCVTPPAPAVTVLPAAGVSHAPDFRADPAAGAVAPYEEALRDEREAHDRTAAILRGLARFAVADQPCWCDERATRSDNDHDEWCDEARAAFAAHEALRRG